MTDGKKPNIPKSFRWNIQQKANEESDKKGKKGIKRTCKKEVKKGLTQGDKGGILVYVLTAAEKQAVTVRDF